MNIEVLKLFSGFGIAGLILAAWIWDSMRKEKMINEAYEKYYSLLVLTTESMTKVKTILQERLPGRGRDGD